MNGKIGVVVVTYNRLTLLKEVIASLRNQTNKNAVIIVVNNGSTDETAEWLEQQGDIVIINQENVGGAGGFYAGIKFAVENGYDYCWIMDDDVICKENALDELVSAYYAKPNIGFVCSKVVGIDGCPMNTPVVDNRVTNNGYADYVDLIDKGMIKVKNATFVSVFFSSSKVRELGLPYKEYFIWGDDYEYTFRISTKYDSYMACKSVVTHKRSIQKALSFDEENDHRRIKNYFYKFRNESYNYLKEYNLGFKGRMKQCMNHFFSFLTSLIRLKFRKSIVYLRVSKALVRFNPQVEFPK